MKNTASEIYKSLCQIPLIDIHTHVDATHLSARGLHDILLYHMVISDLYCAGCPDGSRMTENPDEAEIAFRLERAIPYIKYIQNTSCFWGVKTILKDLYDWDIEITSDNWCKLDITIREKSKENYWPRSILNKAGIKRVSTEFWRGHDHIADDILQYSLEWAFFTRCQFGQFDTALIELEHAWNQDVPGAPLPVSTDRSKLDFKRTINTLEDVLKAVSHYCEKIPYDNILSIASHFSTDIEYRVVTNEEMIKALRNRNNAGPRERDIFANYISELFFNEIARKKARLTLQFSIGAEPLPFETGSKLRSETLFELASLFERHNSLRFSLFISNLHQNQAACTIVRELPNVSLAGYWWHNFFPSAIREVMNERLDMVATNKQFGFFSDAYCVEWAYAKALIVRKQLSVVLSEKIEQGQYTPEQALIIAEQILFKTAQKILGMTPSDF
jgi:hypothetical protein